MTTLASPAFDSDGQSNVGKRLGDRRWFQQAIGGGKPSYDVVVSRLRIGSSSLVIAAPIRTRSGQVIGVVAAGLELDDLRRSVRDVDPSGSDRLVVVDGRGRVIMHSSAQWETETRDLSEEQVFREAQRQETGVTEYRVKARLQALLPGGPPA